METRQAAKGRKLFFLAAVCLLSTLLLSPTAQASRSLPASLAPSLDVIPMPTQVLEEEFSEPPRRLLLFGNLSLPPRPLELVEAQKNATGVSSRNLRLNIWQIGGLSQNCSGPSFQGLWTDPVTGIAYARNRWLDSRTASWLSEDPKGSIDSPNLYAFVAWGPHSGTDPMGLWTQKEQQIIDQVYALNQVSRDALCAGVSWENGDSPALVHACMSWPLHNRSQVDRKIENVDLLRDVPAEADRVRKETALGRLAWQETSKATGQVWDESAGRAFDATKGFTTEQMRAHKAEVGEGEFVGTELESVEPLQRAARSVNEGVIETPAQIGDRAIDVSEEVTKDVAAGYTVAKVITAGSALWTISREGTEAVMRHRRFGKFYKSKSDGSWWTRDTAGHSRDKTVKWKVYREGDKGLTWEHDADEFGTFIGDKHKGPTGRFIPWKDLHGSDF